MSRKRDSNWSRDEITDLLDSIMEITRTRAEDGKRTNSREVFEYAAKKMGEKGHLSRAEREKCRTKWKKMKEEFTHAKRARGGDTRFKEAPGIQPFFNRIEEFINGTFDNISPHSTIVRRTSSLSSGRPSTGMRTSARIAANTNGTSSTGTTSTSTSTSTTTTSTDNNDTSSTIVNKTDVSNEYPSNMHTPTNATSPPSRPRISSGSSSASASDNNGVSTPILPSITTTTLPINHTQQPAISNGEPLCTVYTTYPNSTNNNDPNTSSSRNNTSNTSASLLTSTNDHLDLNPPSEQADISYRVSTGCRQITIFGDHDVDIKFRGDCVTINKIEVDYPSAES